MGQSCLISRMDTIGVFTCLALLFTAVAAAPTSINEAINTDDTLTNPDSSNILMINPSLGQQSFKSAATIQLEELIEKQRLVNIKHQEIQLQQLEAAKTQLAKQIENQKQLQISWLEQSLKEEHHKASQLAMKELKGGDSHTDDEKETVTEESMQARIKQQDRENSTREEHSNNKLISQMPDKMKNCLTSNQTELIHNEEEQNESILVVLEDEPNLTADNDETIMEEQVDSTTETGFRFQELRKLEEGESKETKEDEHTNNLGTEKASSILKIPYKVIYAVQLVSAHFKQQQFNNHSLPEYVLTAVQELSNYLS